MGTERREADREREREETGGLQIAGEVGKL